MQGSGRVCEQGHPARLWRTGCRFNIRPRFTSRRPSVAKHRHPRPCLVDLAARMPHMTPATHDLHRNPPGNRVLRGIALSLACVGSCRRLDARMACLVRGHRLSFRSVWGDDTFSDRRDCSQDVIVGGASGRDRGGRSQKTLYVVVRLFHPSVTLPGFPTSGFRKVGTVEKSGDFCCGVLFLAIAGGVPGLDTLEGRSSKTT